MIPSMARALSVAMVTSAAMGWPFFLDLTDIFNRKSRRLLHRKLARLSESMIRQVNKSAGFRPAMARPQT
jgi:hypothetical protein